MLTKRRYASILYCYTVFPIIYIHVVISFFSPLAFRSLMIVVCPVENISLHIIWRRHDYQQRAATVWPIPSYSLKASEHAGRDLNRATPAVTRGFGFCGRIRRIAQLSHLFTYMYDKQI